MFGKEPIVPDCLRQRNIEPIYNIDDYAKEVKFRLQVAQSRAFQLINKYKEIQKENTI